MTKAEAIEAMKVGKKVTHRYFDEGEYVMMREFGSVSKTDPSIYSLSGKHQVTATMFWSDRSGEHWDEDWEVFNEK